jgi:hypothetical protein
MLRFAIAEAAEGTEKREEEFGIDGTAATRLSKPGAQTISDFNDTKNVMGNPSRRVLVAWMAEMADRALPVERKLLSRRQNRSPVPHRTRIMRA